MLNRRHFLLAAGISSCSGIAQAVTDPLVKERTIRALPKSASELKDQYEASRNYSAELLPENEPYEVKNFVPYLTKRDESDSSIKNPCMRRHAISIGLEVTTDDQKQLPTLSREQILAYLKGHFVSLQARIYREPVSRAMYLGSRCLAATRAFRGSAVTQGFSPTVADSVNNIRSLGLLLPDKTPSTAVNLRTLVLVHKNQLSQQTGNLAYPKVNYEYVFIRARETKREQLELHSFSTSDERTRFHWLKLADNPALPNDCSVLGAVYFTEYSHQGLYPKTAVVRRSLIQGQRSFSWEKVERYAQKAFKLPAFACINQIMDAVIAGDFRD